MRTLNTAATVVAIGILVAACGGDKEGGTSSTAAKPTTTTTAAPTTPPQPPVAQAALPTVFLTPADVDALVGMTGTISAKKVDKLSDDNVNQQWPQGWKFPAECLYVLDPGQAPVYANSGSTAANGEMLTTPPAPGSDDQGPEVNQFVVAFPSDKEANAFFNTSVQQWQGCANRQINAPGDADNPEVAFSLGQVSNANSMLTSTVTAVMSKNGKSMTSACQRAMTVRANVAIDVSGCRKDPGDLAVKVITQIAGKVDSANENLLALSISKGYGLTNCQPVPAAKLTALVLAELDCGQSPDPTGPASAVYQLLPHADALASQFKAMTQDMAMTPCSPDATQSPGTWSQGTSSGQRACGTQKDVATIVWTTEGKNVLGLIRSSATDMAPLHSWWLANG